MEKERPRIVKAKGNGENSQAPFAHEPEELVILTDPTTLKVEREGEKIKLIPLRTGVEEPISSPE